MRLAWLTKKWSNQFRDPYPTLSKWLRQLLKRILLKSCMTWLTESWRSWMTIWINNLIEMRDWNKFFNFSENIRNTSGSASPSAQKSLFHALSRKSATKLKCQRWRTSGLSSVMVHILSSGKRGEILIWTSRGNSASPSMREDHLLAVTGRVMVSQQIFSSLFTLVSTI